MLELRRLECVGGRGRASGRLSRGFPFKIDFLLGNRTCTFDAIALERALQSNCSAGIRSYVAFDEAIPECPLDRVVAQLAGQPVSVEFKLQVIVIWLIEERQPGNP